jgi:kynurenine formamidase
MAGTQLFEDKGKDMSQEAHPHHGRGQHHQCHDHGHVDLCSLAHLDAEVFAKIAANSAQDRVPTKSPFGADDEIGMLNLMSAQSRRNALGNADAGTIFDLSVDFFIGMPSWTRTGEAPYQIGLTASPQGQIVEDPLGVGRAQNELVSRSSDAISMFTHTGTHIDTLNHFGYNGRIWNNFSASEHLGSRHWLVAGAEKQPPIMARGIMLDIAALKGVDCLPDSYGIGAADIQDCLRHQRIQLAVGDVVLIRTGRMKYWPDAERFMPREPGLNLEGAKFLARAGAMLIGADNLGLEQMPSADPENWQVVHTYLMAEAGIPIMEIVYLEELSAERVYEFLLVGACLKLRGATGSPIRPLALPYTRR